MEKVLSIQGEEIHFRFSGADNFYYASISLADENVQLEIFERDFPTGINWENVAAYLEYMFKVDINQLLQNSLASLTPIACQFWKTEKEKLNFQCIGLIYKGNPEQSSTVNHHHQIVFELDGDPNQFISDPYASWYVSFDRDLITKAERLG